MSRSGDGGRSAVRRPAHRAGMLTGSAPLERDPLDVALEADDARILRAEDVQAGRRGPAWTS